MAVGRRMVIMYLLVVWCCADTLVVRALPPSPIQRHEESAVSSGDPLMGALQVVTSPDHHHHHDLSTPDHLKQPETSISVHPVIISDPLELVIAGGVCPCNSPASPRTKGGDDERWEEGRKQERSEKGSSSGEEGHGSVAIDVRESGEEEGEDRCAVCQEEIGAEGGAGEGSTISSWNGGHRFHPARIQGVSRCPLCRCSCNGLAAPVRPGERALINLPLFYHLTCGGSILGVIAWGSSIMTLTFLSLYVVLIWLVGRL